MKSEPNVLCISVAFLTKNSHGRLQDPPHLPALAEKLHPASPTHSQHYQKRSRKQASHDCRRSTGFPEFLPFMLQVCVCVHLMSHRLGSFTIGVPLGNVHPRPPSFLRVPFAQDTK